MTPLLWLVIVVTCALLVLQYVKGSDEDDDLW